MKKSYILFLLLFLIYSSQISASSIYLDADTVATGSTLDSSALITPLGTVTFIGTFNSSASDLEFVAAGSTGNAFNIGANDQATLSFDFDVSSLTFIFGGNMGVFDIVARDINGNTVDSYFLADTYNGAFAGPITLAGQGIRSIFWQDPGYTYSAIDNITINTSAVPIPAAVWLFGSGLLSLIGFSKRKRAS